MRKYNVIYIYIYIFNAQNVRASLMNFSGIPRAPLGRTLSLPMLIFAINVIIIIIMYQVKTGKYGNSPMSIKIKLK